LTSVVFLVCVDWFSLNSYASQNNFLRYIYFIAFIFEACHVTIQWSSIHLITLITISFKPKHTYIWKSLKASTQIQIIKSSTVLWKTLNIFLINKPFILEIFFLLFSIQFSLPFKAFYIVLVYIFI
jgi:hypothetical protein